MKRRHRKARLLLEELEPRILHSADAAALVPIADGAQLVEMRVVDLAPAPEIAQVAQTAEARREIVIVDAAVTDYQALVDALQAEKGRALEVYVLDAGSGGVAQIGDILKGQRDLAAVHLISHGSEGALELGSTVLDSAALQRDRDSIAAWADALTADADLLIYGCDVASGPQGQAFVDALAALTGADVAASTDVTGAAARGGNWTLEYRAGSIETATPLTAAVQAAWQGTLGHVDKAETWTPTVAGSWQTKDLSGGLFNVPANAVLEVAISNSDTVNAQSGGVRATGSALDREFALNRPSIGKTSMTMLVQADASGRIETFASDTGAISYTLLGYWTNGTYVEAAGSFSAASDGTWEAHSLSAYGVTAGSVAEVVITNTSPNSPQVGVRTENSSINRAFDIRNRGTGTGTEAMTMLVKAGASGNIEAYTESDHANVTFNVVGYWSVAPGTYVERFTDLGQPGTDGTWEAKSLAPDGVPDGAVAEVLLVNNETNVTNDAGVRSAGSIEDPRVLSLNSHGTTGTPGPDNARMFAVASRDGSASIEWVNTHAATSAFYLTGYFQNDAPVLLGANALTSIAEDSTPGAGNLVSEIVNATDANGEVVGIAVTAIDNTHGTWQYSTDGTTWNPIGSVSATSALLLAPTAHVRFAPAANWNGTVTNGLTFRAWDQSRSDTADTTANGGSTAFSATSASASITVSSVNDAPAGADKTITMAEDAVYTFTVADFGLTDPLDSPANALLAVKVGSVPGAGSLALNGIAVTAGQSISAANITAGNLKFTPVSNANGAGYASFTFQVQDNGGTANGGVDLEAGSHTLTFDVTAVNDAPALSGTNDLSGINRNPTSNPGTLVADLLAGHVSDVETDALSGIAVTGVDNTNGAWQYSTDGGSTWTAFGAQTATAARLLAADVNTFVRFVPNTNYSGSVAGLTFRAWDQTSGAAGGTANASVGGTTTAFSSATATASIVVTASNTAPTLSGANNLGAINEDATGNAGTLVTALIASMTGDVDPGAASGIAVTAVDNSNGAWEYSVNGGTTWTAFGTPSATAARLLAADANTAVRFVPNTNWNGTVSNGLTFRAWDRTTGVNGGTADTSGTAGTFRDDFQTASYSNSNGSLAWSGPWVETDSSGGGASGGHFEINNGMLTLDAATAGNNIYREVDLSGSTGASLSFTFLSGLKTTARFEVQVSSNGGASYTTLAGGVFDSNTNKLIGTRTYDISAFISSQTRVRWLVAGAAPTDNSLFLTQLEIEGTGRSGGSTAFSTSTASSSVTVNAVNDAPVRTAGTVNNLTVLEDAPVTSLGLGSLAYSASGGADEAAQTLTYTVTAVPAAALGSIVLADGTTTVAASTTYSLAQLQGMQFKAAANANGGPATFSWTVADSGGTGNGGVDTLTQSLTIAVTSVNDAPHGADKSVTIPEDGTYTFVASDFGFADGSDAPANALSAVKIGTIPGAGSLTLSGVAVTAGQSISIANINAGNLRYAPAANANGAGYASFTFRVQDDGGAANGGVDLEAAAHTVTIDVTSVNDAPSGANKTVTTPEDAPYTFVLGDFGFSDSDGNALAAVKIATLPGAGALTLHGVAVIAGQSIAAADITAGDLVFTAAADGNGAAYASFTFQVQDDGGVAAGGADLDPTPRTMTVAVTAVNDAPSGADKTVTTREDAAYTFLIADFGFSDVRDSNALAAVKIGTVPGAGSLTLSGVAVTAGQSIAASAIAGGNLRYTPAPNANGAAYSSFTFQVQDDGGTAGSGVDIDPVARTLTIDVTAVNDAPSGADKTVTTLEDAPYTFVLGDFGYSDSDGNALAAVRIATLPGAGALTLHGVAVTAGQSIAAAAITAGDLVFTPASDGNGAAYASFTFQVQDDGGTANSGVDLDPTPRTMTVAVTSVNDAPSGADRTVTTREDAAYTFLIADFGFSDVRDSNAPAAVKIGTVPGAGSLTLSGVAVTAGQSIAASAIAAGNLRYSPAPNANGAGYASFTFQVQDDGGTAHSGIDLDPVARTMTIDVTAVNDAPGGADKTVTTPEDAPYTFVLADFGFTDTVESDGFAGVKIASVPGAGALTLNGVAVTANQVVSAASIVAGNLEFAPAADANGPTYASFTFQVQDAGGTANGGADLDPTARTMTVAVTSVNDAPSGADNTVTTREDSAYTFAIADFGFSDARDADALAAVKIGTVPGAGSLTLSGVAVTAGQSIAAAAIAAGNLRYAPAANANGAAYASFSFQVQDDGGTASGGVDLDPTARTMTMSVLPVNDAPAGADRTVATLEDTAYTFAAADFGFGDAVEANALLGVRMETVPVAGSLVLSGVAVTAGQTISAADIAAGNLRYTPATNADGAGYASFAFRVQDDGGIANGGVDLDPVARTMTVDVTAVNDAPSGADRTVTTLEDTAYTFAIADFGFVDAADGNTLSGVRISSVPAAGTLTLSGVAVTANQVVSAASIAAGDLVFAPAANANGAAYASFAFRVQDDGGTADGGADTDALARTLTIAVTPVNDAPSAADKTVTTLEDTPYTFTAGDFGFADANDAAGSAGANALAAVRISSLPLTGTLVNDFVPLAAGDLVSAADIAAGKLMYMPALDGNGGSYASFTFEVRDDGGTLSGGADFDPTPRTMTVAVTSVNDAPSGADRTIATLEDASYVFAAADFGFSDRDGNAFAGVRIAALPVAGTLTLHGVAVSANQLVSAADIAAGDLVYAPAADANGAAYASFTFRVQDDGGIADGGADTDALAHTMTIAVTAVNDAPSGSDNTVTTLEDTPYRYTLADFGFTDARDGNAFAALRIVTPPGSGSLTLAGVAVGAGQVISAAGIAAGDLVYTPAANANGAAQTSFAFQVGDDGGVAGGGVDFDVVARTMTIDVVPVNDAPRGRDATIAMREGATYTFALADFGYADAADAPANALIGVRITALTGSGMLLLGDTAVAAGDVVPVARIVAGDLVFAPGTSGSGAGYAILAFRVQDDGGTANGGVDSDGAERTITVDVARKPVPVDAVAPGAAVPPPPPPQQTIPAAEAVSEQTPSESRNKSTLARIAAELDAAAAQALKVPMIETGGEVIAPVRAETRPDGVASIAPASSSAARGAGAPATAIGVPVVLDLRADGAPPPQVLPAVAIGARSAASGATDANESSADQDDAKRQAYALLTLENGVRASAIIVSVGAVGWTLHGAGLLASLLTSAPAWRHLDPLPVLAPESEKPDWGDGDGDSQREEDAADRLWLGSASSTARTL